MTILVLSTTLISLPSVLILIAVLAAFAIVRLFLGYPPAPLKSRRLSAREQALVLAAADTFFAQGGPIPLSGTEAGVLSYFDAYFERCPPHQQLLIRLLLLSTELGPLAFGPWPSRFTRLNSERRTRFFAEAFSSRLYFRRLSFISLRAIMTMAYLAHPEVARRMGMIPNTDPFNLSEAA